MEEFFARSLDRLSIRYPAAPDSYSRARPSDEIERCFRLSTLLLVMVALDVVPWI